MIEPALLSVCVPIYNKAGALPRLFESLLRENLPRLEVVALDNASKDDTARVLDAWKGRLNLKVHTLPRTISLYDNWLLALSLGSGKYLRLQLADDGVPDGCLKAMVAALEQNPNLGAVFARSVHVDDDGREIASGIVNDYCHIVNEARRTIAGAKTLAEKARAFRRARLCDSQLGDPNPIVFRSDLLPLLRKGVSGLAPAFQSWPEFEIGLRLMVLSETAFLDIPGTTVSFDRLGSLPLMNNRDWRRRAKDMVRINSLFLMLLDPDLREFRRHLGKAFLARFTLWHLARLARIAVGRA